MSQVEEASRSTATLTYGEAGSRLLVVTVIQFLGVLFFVVPLVTPAIQKEGWQRSCLYFGGFSALGLASLLIISFYAALRHFKGLAHPFDVWKTELAIGLAFGLNNLALALAMARTGGVLCSIYAQMIPMQLAGMLLLAQQKEAFTTKRSVWPLLYPAIALLSWGISAWFGQWLANAKGWATTISPDERGFGFLSPGLLVCCEIILMAFAYFFPRSFSKRESSSQPAFS